MLFAAKLTNATQRFTAMTQYPVKACHFSQPNEVVQRSIFLYDGFNYVVIYCFHVLMKLKKFYLALVKLQWINIYLWNRARITSLSTYW